MGFFSPTRVGRKGHISPVSSGSNSSQQCLQWAHLSCEHLGAIHPRWEECPQLKLGAPQPPCSYKSPSPPHPQAVPGPSDTRSPSGTSSRPCLHPHPRPPLLVNVKGPCFQQQRQVQCCIPGVLLSGLGPLLTSQPPPPLRARTHTHTLTHTHTQRGHPSPVQC